MDTGTQAGGKAGGLSTNRRGFVALGAAAVVPSAALPLTGAHAATRQVEVTSRAVSLSAASGQVAARIFQPGAGEHPGLVMWATPSDGSQAIARGLAEQGWAVLLVSARVSGHEAIVKDARTLVAWLSGQDGVRQAGPVERTGLGLGHGYVLRAVSAAQPRLSLANRADRADAAASAWLFAVPEAEVKGRSARLAQLEAAVRGAYRVGALAA